MCRGLFEILRTIKLQKNTKCFIASKIWRNIMKTYKTSNIILHIPHSSTYLPQTFKVSEGVCLKNELERMTDWFTDELFDFEEAIKLIFPYSRLYCDVERFRKDRDEPMARKGMGVCYTNTSYGTKLREVSSREKIFIKSNIYDTHHEKLEGFVNEELTKQRSSLIVDCHSFHSSPLPHEDSMNRPDICLGTDDFHTPNELTEYVKKYFEKHGLSVTINEPFSGTMVPLKFYHRDKRVKSIMIEINRDLYLNHKFEKNDRFGQIKEHISELLNLISKSHFI